MRDIADVDIHAEFDALLSCHTGTALSQRAPDIDSTTHRIDDTGEFDQQALGVGFDNASAMFLDRGVADPLQSGESAFLVLAHKS